MAKIRIDAAGLKEHPFDQGCLKRALSDTEAGCYIGMSKSWLRHIRLEGAGLNHLAGPRFIKVGRSVRYLREDLDVWLEQFQRWDHLAQHDTDRLSAL